MVRKLPTNGRTTLKYITRIDSGSTHCWWVRMGYDIKEKVHKSFPDRRHGGSTGAYLAAKKFRDKELKRLLPLMKDAYKYDQNDQRHWGVGVTETWTRKGDYEYMSITATYWDGNRGKQLHKQFSVNKYGYELAWKLAAQWRSFKLTGEL